MNKNLRYEFWGFIFISVIGTLLHFLYVWSGEINFVGTFSPVNESVWEHLKLIFIPSLAWTMIGYFMVFRETKGYITEKAASVFLGMALITSVFYVYTGIIGRSFVAVDIILFYIGVLAASLYAVKNAQNEKHGNALGIAFFAFFLAAFVILTFKSPEIGIFSVPA